MTRPGGVPWPTPAEGPIFRDVLPAEYSAVARANGVVTAGIVEASGIVEDNQWILDLVRHDRFYPNLYMKFSSFYDMYAPGDVVYPTPTELGPYKAHFDVLMTAFGANRLIWGSNWPVITLHGTFEAQIAIAEAYLAPFGTAVRDKVMFKNALAFYRRRRR